MMNTNIVGNKVTSFHPVMDMEACVNSLEIFNDFKQKVILINKDNYTTGKDGRVFLNKMAFRQVALFYNLSDHVEKEERVEIKDEKGAVKAIGWKIWTKVYSNDRMFFGRSVIGVGMCLSNEPHKVFNHGETDMYHTAATRSKNRAINDFVGGMAGVSLEEMDLISYNESISDKK